MIRETRFQSQVESYQRLKKWYLIPPCLTLSIIRYVLLVKWSNPRKGAAPSPTPQCRSYRKGSLRVTLDYSHQLYLLINPRFKLPWTRGKILCVTYLETESFKSVQEKIRKKLNFNSHLKKSQIYRCIHKFQAWVSVNDLDKNIKNLRSDRSWQQNVQTMWMRWEILLE